MAENKTQPTAVNAADFIAAIPDGRRRQDCEAIAALMQGVMGEPPVMWGGSIVEFGRYTCQGVSLHPNSRHLLGNAELISLTSPASTQDNAPCQPENDRDPVRRGGLLLVCQSQSSSQ